MQNHQEAEFLYPIPGAQHEKPRSPQEQPADVPQLKVVYPRNREWCTAGCRAPVWDLGGQALTFDQANVHRTLPAQREQG